MNDGVIIDNMISFIEEEEKNLQASKMTGGNATAKTDIVNNILEKLEKEIEDEN